MKIYVESANKYLVPHRSRDCKLLHSGNIVCKLFTGIINRELASLVSNLTYSQCVF